eukprot:Gregarina_sp_Poly_1__5707@NODE_2_length_28028_cov_167_134223_g1_i0_p1_GENE_NODE_2_length_28028_cov_167_134223_g1_i0NODE_2_length_28028_cov_167_134223_g1_i0_p1_ORF_typecomplete_len1363_score209_40IMCp/PF12314_8/1_2e12IMCp/PF12314_8/7_1e03FecR/PF04773_13/9e02FecR/PF04773_13/42FecR/PF04773_13/1_8e04FecR/PF04773_13/1_8e04FecR/PF04773_13/2_8e02_NODE_2_length_28028_cov_167_134223_g1_i038157903
MGPGQHESRNLSGTPQTSCSRDNSPSKGKMTITLTSAAGETDETAKVKIELNNPELVAERVVTQLARKFPPESVVTIATDTHHNKSSSSSSGDSHDERTSISSHQRLHKLVREDIPDFMSESSVGAPQFATSQYYLVSRELDTAVPVADTQKEIRLFDGSCIAVDESQVYTVHYDETGHAMGAANGFDKSIRPILPLPDKPGIATFTQDYFVSNELELAVPIVPGQKVVHLVDGSTVDINPQDVVSVFYGEKGLGLFYRQHDGLVAPGFPAKRGVAISCVPHQSTGSDSVPIASSEVMPLKSSPSYRKNISVVLFDAKGEPICVRNSSGGLVPGRLESAGSVASVEYFYAPIRSDNKAASTAAQIVGVEDSRARLSTGVTVPMFAEDVVVCLKSARGKDIGVFKNDRRPSLARGTLEDHCPTVWKQARGGSLANKDNDQIHRTSAPEQRGQSAGRRRNSPDVDSNHSSRRRREGRRSSPPKRREELWARTQSYCYSDDIDYAIPILPEQGHIKLSDGKKIPVEKNKLYAVDYDIRGFPMVTVHPDGRVSEWAVEKPGIAIKVQDYFIHKELLYAVPVIPGQREVTISDGTTVPITSRSVVSVYYDAHGKPVFSISGSNRRIRPGLTQKPGVAWSVQYFNLIDADDGTGEQFVVPFKGYQSKIDDPRRLQKIAVDRDAIVTVFFDKNRRPLYSQLADGSLVGGGLLGSRQGSTDEDSHSISSDYVDCPVRIKKSRGPSNVGPGRPSVASSSFHSSQKSEVEMCFDYAGNHVKAERVSSRAPVKIDYLSDLTLPAKAQPYVISNELQYAVPIVPEQTEIVMLDGSSLEVEPADTALVFYNALGNLLFHRMVESSTIFDGPPTKEGIVPTVVAYAIEKDSRRSRSGSERAYPMLVGGKEYSSARGQIERVQESDTVAIFYGSDGLPVFSQNTDGSLVSGILDIKGAAARIVSYFFPERDKFCYFLAPGQREVRLHNGSKAKITPQRLGHVLLNEDGDVVGAIIPGHGVSHKLTREVYRAAGGSRSKKVGSAGVGGSNYWLSPDSSVASVDRWVSEYDVTETGALSNSARRHHRESIVSNLSSAGSAIVGTRSAKDLSRRRINERGGTLQPPNRDTTPGSTYLDSEYGSRSSSKRQEIIERRIPKHQIEYVEKIVEVPEVHYVDKHVEVEQIEWQTKIVKKKQIVERPVEHVKYVPKIETKIIERVIEVPQIIEVPRPEIIEQKVKVDRFVDKKKAAVVSQTFKPVIRDGLDVIEEVECLKLEPKLIPVDVYVPKLKRSMLIAVGPTKEQQKEIDVPLAHYNSLVLKMNPMYANNYEKLPLVKADQGSFPLLPSDQRVTVVNPTNQEIADLLKSARLISRTIGDKH